VGGLGWKDRLEEVVGVGFNTKCEGRGLFKECKE